jgi:hypothetical protein
MQFDYTSREIVVDAPARCTKRVVAAFGCRSPLPAPLVVDGTTTRTESALVQLFSLLIRVENMILLGVSSAATIGGTPS